ncbi:MAG: methylmalonyl-CoA epimerase, partial [Balneolaceae bacterium]
MHIDHIGIAVDNLEEAVKSYEKLLNKRAYKREIVANQKVETVFFQAGESKIELLGATSADSVIASFINKKGTGIHHIAFEVKDLDSEMVRLKKEGYRLLSDTPTPGADNKRIVFLHPKDCHGVLI